MDKENKNLIKYILIIFISQLLIYPLPHDSYSLIQYIVPEIQLANGSVMYVSGFTSIILLVIAARGLSKLERFRDKDKVVIFLIVLVIVPPLITWSLDQGRAAYHIIRDDELIAIDIKESHIQISSNDDELKMKVNLKLKDYCRKENEFKIRVYVPESISTGTNREFYDFENEYHTGGNVNIYDIYEEIAIEVVEENDKASMLKSAWWNEAVEYELYNAEETVRIIDHGL